MSYRLEYSKSAQAGCKGPKPCSGTKIGKGELRFGTVVDIMGRTSFQWRHWGCLTKTVLANVKSKIDKPEEIDGFEDLREEDQERVKKAYETGHIAPEDIPESAKVKGEDGDESPADEGRPAKEGHSSPNKTKAPAPKAKSKSKQAKAKDEEELEDEKPKKKKAAAPAKKRAKKEATPDEDSEEEVEAVSTDEEEKPKKKKARSSKSKSKSKKRNSEFEADSPAPTPRKPSTRRTANKASMKEEDDDDDE